MNGADEGLPAKIYWRVAIVAVVVMLLLWAFTSAYNIPLGAS